MSALIKTVKFYNGFECPIVGLGTWRGQGSEVHVAVKQAILNGYRHIDTAMLYGNESEVGKAIKEVFEESNISRKDLFIVTKLPDSCNRQNLVVPALQKSLKDLALEYVDLYLIHTPVSKMPLGDDVVSSDSKSDENGKSIFEDINPVTTWKEMEQCVDMGLAKSIGVSNFNSAQIQAVLDSCTIKPVTNQVECHPLLSQKKLREFCKKNDILITSYRPLGGQKRKSDDPNILGNKVVEQIASKYKKLPSQILLRWHVQQDLIVLAKSTQIAHIMSNADIFNFTLSDEDMKQLDELECGHRYCPFLDSVSSKQYPFHDEF